MRKACLLIILLITSTAFATPLPSALDNAIDSMQDVTDAEKQYYKEQLADFLSSKTQEFANDYLIRVAEESGYVYTEAGGKVLSKLSMAKDAIDWFKAYDDFEKNPSSENDIRLSEAAMQFYSNFMGPAGILFSGMISVMKGERERISNLNALKAMIDDAIRANEDKISIFQNGKNLIESSTDAQLVWYIFKDYSDTSNIYDLEEPRWGLLKYMSDSRIDELSAYMVSHPDTGINAYNSGAFLRYMKGGGPGFIGKHSPVYLLITDPLGNKYGVNASDKELLCANDSLCTPLINASDPEVIAFPELFNGTYTIRLYGFNDGNYTLTFKGFNNSYSQVINQEVTGYVHKGEILESVLIVNRTGASSINFVSVGNFTPGVNPELMPLKLLELTPGNGSFVTSGKPVIKAVFNKPLGFNYSLKILGDGIISYEDNKTLFFFPLNPLVNGEYVIDLSNVKDVHGLSLESNRTSVFNFHSTYAKGLKYSLSNARIINATRYFHFRNNGTNNLVLTVDMALIQDRLPGTLARINSYSLQPNEFRVDEYGNKRAHWSSIINPGESIDFIVNYTVLLFSTDYFSYVNVSSVGSTVINDYSTNSYVNLQSSDSGIVSLSESLTNSADNDFIKAFRINEWVRQNVRYDNSYSYPNDALSVLSNRLAVCQGYATLYAALARAAGLPTRYVTGITMSDSNGTDFKGHAWNEVYINSIGWVTVDPTWARGVNDWFLNTDSSHALLLNIPGWPMEGTDWINWDTGGGYDYSFYVTNYSVVDSRSLWNDSLKELYNAVKALDLKKKVLNYAFYNGSFNINKTSGSYDYVRVYPNLSMLGSDYLMVQEGDYSLVNSVYDEIIGLYSRLLNEYYSELSVKYIECSKLRACTGFDEYFDSSFNKTLGELFTVVNNSLINSSVMLGLKDYEGVFNELSIVTDVLERGVNWNRIHLMYTYLTVIEWYSSPVTEAVDDIAGLIDNATLGSNVAFDELSPEAQVIALFIMALIFVFPLATWLVCLAKGGKSHGRFYWLSVIFFLNFIGAIYYWIKEH